MVEYRVRYTGGDDLQRILNIMARRGWEVVVATPFRTSGAAIDWSIIFKRRLEEVKEEEDDLG